MDKKTCRKAISHINPRDGFIEDTIEMLEKKQKQHVNRNKIIRIAGLGGAAAAIIAITVLAAVTGMFSASAQPKASVPAVIAQVTEQPAPAETAKRLVLNGSPIAYSSLNFGYTGKIEYPDASGMEKMCLEAFSEQDIKESQLVIKGTVEDAHIKNYFKNAKTAIYHMCIDRIFYSQLDVKEGDIFTVEQELYGGSLCDAEFGLQPGGQYILPIYEGNGQITDYGVDETEQTAKLESQYSIVYPFQPMIQATTDGGYLFFGGKDENGPKFGWGSLVDENTVDVIMNVGTVYGRESYVNNMKLRADDEFEEDFQALVDYYCTEEYDPGKGGYYDIPYRSEISGEKARDIAEDAAGGINARTDGYFDVGRLEWVITVESWYPDENVIVRLSPSGEVLEVIRDENAGGGNTEIVEVGVCNIDVPASVDDVIVPFYLPQRLSDGTGLHCGITKDGPKAWIWNGDTLLIEIRYLDAGSEFLKSAPEIGKAAVTAKDGKLELVMPINKDIGCIMKAEGISLEELIKTAGSFGNDEKPANNMPYNRGYD